MLTEQKPTVAILIPCRNEAATIATVITDFRAVLPVATIHVFDNNSTDETMQQAEAAGAIVWQEKRQGKGNVVRRMFAEVEADVYVIVDGDATYDAPSAPRMVQLLLDQHLDMVVARRVTEEQLAYRIGHRSGNQLMSATIGFLFGQHLTDIMSGFRVFSRRFVKSFPASSRGFETEAELTVHALQMRLPIAEIKTPYYARPAGSFSKLNTWTDGFRVMGKILRLFSLEKPLLFFSSISAVFFVAASALFIPVLLEYFSTGLVPKFPSLIVAVGGYLMMVLSLMIGVILRATSAARLEAQRYAYLNVRPLSAGSSGLQHGPSA